jgi:peptidoglycan/xylan/chitin deacetylase (PgdA/CDA1 family)
MAKGAHLRDFIVAAGFCGLRATRLHRLGGAAWRGLGAILMLHHVRPPRAGALRMNRGLAITPEFLAETIETLLELGFDLVSLDQAVAILAQGGHSRPFAALTFDDGYRDNLEYAEPVLRRYGAPYAIYVAPGFADGAVRAWWEDLETAIQHLPRVAVRLGDESFDLQTRDAAEKNAAGDFLAPRLRLRPDAEARATAAALLAQAGIEVPPGDPSFMDWDEIRGLAASPLCAIGAHTLTHPRLAGLAPDEARHEMSEAKRRIEAELGLPVRHFAYPYGGADAAGEREFGLARALGFASAATTRPGMIFSDHANHAQALPRLSVNGAWQSRPALETLLSGLPFALWNRGRRLNVA